jgi:hypothetical protein
VVLEALASLSAPTREPDDARTPEQRRADALVEICRRHLDSGAFPTKGGERPHLQVTVDLATLLGESLVDLEAGPITAEAVRRLGCDASVSRIVFGPDDEPLQVGRATRTVSVALRRALDLRDQHCTHPGCDAPAPWCDAHHIVHWAKGARPGWTTCGCFAGATTAGSTPATPTGGVSEAPPYPVRQAQAGSWGRVLLAARKKA